MDEETLIYQWRLATIHATRFARTTLNHSRRVRLLLGRTRRAIQRALRLRHRPHTELVGDYTNNILGQVFQLLQNTLQVMNQSVDFAAEMASIVNQLERNI